MPRSKYTKVPGPPQPIKQIRFSTFQFHNIARRKLLGLLPLRLHQLNIPEDIKQAAVDSPGARKPKTLAELIVVYTEILTKAYLTEKGLGDFTPANPANVNAAIRKLREAFKPFREGVDEETASIIPDDLDDLDKWLASRHHDIAKLRLAPYQRRRLDLLCQHIGVFLTEIASANQVTFEIPGMIKFITTALDYAGIEHSYSAENPSRFAARVFPKLKNSK